MYSLCHQRMSNNPVIAAALVTLNVLPPNVSVPRPLCRMYRAVCAHCRILSLFFVSNGQVNFAW
jgi:hypothetical protein